MYKENSFNEEPNPSLGSDQFIKLKRMSARARSAEGGLGNGKSLRPAAKRGGSKGNPAAPEADPNKKGTAKGKALSNAPTLSNAAPDQQPEGSQWGIPNKLGDSNSSLRPRERDSRLKRPINHQTGPVTEEGKQAVSQNARKHGGYALPRRGDTNFESIEYSVIGMLEPIGEIQQHIAKSICFELWRIGNIERGCVELERDIDHESVSLTQLAMQLEFPFADIYREVLRNLPSEETLRARVHVHVVGIFSTLLEKTGQERAGLGLHMSEPNERAARILERGRELLAKPGLMQHMHQEFFEEFDAVMLDARLGRNSLTPSNTPGPKPAGFMLPLAQCWAYRNYGQIRLTEHRLRCSLRMDLMTSPNVERALRSARARLNALLRDYIASRPDLNSRRIELLGFWSG
jgi:hypothetical protein